MGRSLRIIAIISDRETEGAIISRIMEWNNGQLFWHNWDKPRLEPQQSVVEGDGFSVVSSF